MKPLLVGLVLAVVLPMLAIYLSDLLSLDIPTWAVWPLLAVPLLGGTAIGLGDLFCTRVHAHYIGRNRHHG
jgi:hypothetical protein